MLVSQIWLSSSIHSEKNGPGYQSSRANLFSQVSRCGSPTRILGHPEVIEDQPHTALELPDFLRHTGHAFSFDQANGKPSEPRDVFRPVFGTDTAPVFIPVPVEDIVTTILNAPMAPIGDEDLLRGGLVWWATGDAIGQPRERVSVVFSRRSRSMTKACPT